MADLGYLKAVLLGLVQGLTEFLPVSSSGHLVLVQELFGLQQDSPQMLAFTVVSHFGTLLAVAVVFAAPFIRLLRSRTHAPRILGLGIVGCAVTAAVAFPFKDFLESLFTRVPLVAVALACTGVLLFAVDRLPRPRRGWRQFGWLAAAAVGLAQAAAITPGISRSGATICVAMMLGLRRRWAAEFSFLIAAPAIVGATAIKIKDLLDTPLPEGGSYGAGPIIVGGLVAAVVGYFALRMLLRMLQQARLHWFSYYLWILAAAMLVVPLFTSD